MVTHVGVSVRFNECYLFEANNLSELTLGPAYPVAKRMFEDINASIKQESEELKSAATPGKICCHLTILIGTCGFIFCPLMCWAFNIAKLQQSIKGKVSSKISSYEVELRQVGFTAIVHNRIVYTRRHVSEGLPERIEISPILPLNLGVINGINVVGVNTVQINDMQKKMEEMARANLQMRQELEKIKNDEHNGNFEKNDKGQTQDINAPNPY